VQTIVGLSRGLILISCVCYLAAVIIALPLGVPGIMREEWALVPLSAGGILLGLGMIGEVHQR
jgi:hypothetical protein